MVLRKSPLLRNGKLSRLLELSGLARGLYVQFIEAIWQRGSRMAD